MTIVIHLTGFLEKQDEACLRCLSPLSNFEEAECPTCGHYLTPKARSTPYQEPLQCPTCRKPSWPSFNCHHCHHCGTIAKDSSATFCNACDKANKDLHVTKYAEFLKNKQPQIVVSFDMRTGKMTTVETGTTSTTTATTTPTTSATTTTTKSEPSIQVTYCSNCCLNFLLPPTFPAEQAACPKCLHPHKNLTLVQCSRASCGFKFMAPCREQIGQETPTCPSCRHGMPATDKCIACSRGLLQQNPRPHNLPPDMCGRCNAQEMSLHNGLVESFERRNKSRPSMNTKNMTCAWCDLEFKMDVAILKDNIACPRCIRPLRNAEVTKCTNCQFSYLAPKYEHYGEPSSVCPVCRHGMPPKDNCAECGQKLDDGPRIGTQPPDLCDSCMVAHMHHANKLLEEWKKEKDNTTSEPRPTPLDDPEPVRKMRCMNCSHAYKMRATRLLPEDDACIACLTPLKNLTSVVCVKCEFNFLVPKNWPLDYHATCPACRFGMPEKDNCESCGKKLIPFDKTPDHCDSCISNAKRWHTQKLLEPKNAMSAVNRTKTTTTTTSSLNNDTRSVHCKNCQYDYEVRRSSSQQKDGCPNCFTPLQNFVFTRCRNPNNTCRYEFLIPHNRPVTVWSDVCPSCRYTQQPSNNCDKCTKPLRHGPGDTPDRCTSCVNEDKKRCDEKVAERTRMADMQNARQTTTRNRDDDDATTTTAPTEEMRWSKYKFFFFFWRLTIFSHK